MIAGYHADLSPAKCSGFNLIASSTSRWHAFARQRQDSCARSPASTGNPEETYRRPATPIMRSRRRRPPPGGPTSSDPAPHAASQRRACALPDPRWIAEGKHEAALIEIEAGRIQGNRVRFRRAIRDDLTSEWMKLRRRTAVSLNCEYCDKDLPPNSRKRGSLVRMHVLRGLRREQLA